MVHKGREEKGREDQHSSPSSKHVASYDCDIFADIENQIVEYMNVLDLTER